MDDLPRWGFRWKPLYLIGTCEEMGSSKKFWGCGKMLRKTLNGQRHGGRIRHIRFCDCGSDT